MSDDYSRQLFHRLLVSFSVTLYLLAGANLFVDICFREHDEIGEMVERLMEQETRPAIFDTPPGTQNPSIPMAKF